ncbi:MAG TPA: preprotein translocase subunit SecY [Armatimonadota bacterium]|jgi:preprotein translocase subunit SecY
MLQSLVAALQLPDLRKRILFVLGMFAIFELGLHIPVPGINPQAMERLFDPAKGGMALGFLDIFSGGALRKYTIFAMGITPYINASIIMQLLTVAIPQLEQLAKEGGESGRKQISQYTRYLTAGLAFLQAIGMNIMLTRGGILQASIGEFFLIVLTLTAGTAFLMWIGDQVTEKGIGNGVSLIIFASIMARLPAGLSEIWAYYREGAIAWTQVALLALLWLATVVGVVAITQATRRIPIQHAKRLVGNKQYGGTSSYLPFKVNSAGVIPIIFAMSLLMIPMTLASFVSRDSFFGGFMQGAAQIFSPGSPGIKGVVGSLLEAGLIIFFTYFYTAVMVNVPDIADNLKKWGSFIPGIRPGKPTLEYLDRVMTRITLAGAIFLALIALLQYWIPAITGIHSTNFGLYGGTSLLIVVGVALETMQTMEAHLMMRTYEGFIK